MFSITGGDDRGRWRKCCCHSRRICQSDPVVIVGTGNFKPSCRTASGHPLPVVGTKVPVVELGNGDKMSMTFAVRERDGATGDSSRMVKAGHAVVLWPNEIFKRIGPSGSLFPSGQLKMNSFIR